MDLVRQQPQASALVEISQSMQANLAMRTAKVSLEDFSMQLQAVGEVSFDESMLTHIHSRVNGWMEQFSVFTIGDKVTKGQQLYSLYSPQLITAQDDYLLALRAVLASNGLANSKEILRRARFRLNLLGFDESLIKQLDQTQQTLYTVPFFAPNDGVVVKMGARKGMYIEPASEILSIAQLDKVWVHADVFGENQTLLQTGLDAQVTLQDGSTFEGKVSYLYPEYDQKLRSQRVRISLNNPNKHLKPNALAQVSIMLPVKPDVLTIPVEALIQTQHHNRVVTMTDNGFRAVAVTVGHQNGDKVEVISGLSLGDVVVTSGQFMIDSEASLRGGAARLAHDH